MATDTLSSEFCAWFEHGAALLFRAGLRRLTESEPLIAAELLKTALETTDNAPAVYTKRGACEYLGVGRTKFDQLRRKGLVPDRRVDGALRFFREDLDAYLRNEKGG